MEAVWAIIIRIPHNRGAAKTLLAKIGLQNNNYLRQRSSFNRHLPFSNSSLD
jgi:hypothetical protein